MELDDLASTESAFVAATTATILSPRVRGVLRRGAVYGVAGVLKAGDVVAGAARGAARGMRDGSATAAAGAHAPAADVAEAPEARPRRRTRGQAQEES